MPDNATLNTTFSEFSENEAMIAEIIIFFVMICMTCMFVVYCDKIIEFMIACANRPIIYVLAPRVSKSPIRVRARSVATYDRKAQQPSVED